MNTTTLFDERPYPKTIASEKAPVHEAVSPWRRIALWTGVAACAFHAAYASPYTVFLVVLCLFALLQLAQAPTWRKAFYPGLGFGLLIAAGRLDFFWNIFGPGASVLWLVFALWIGLFTALARLCLQPGRLAERGAARTPAGAGFAHWGWFMIPFVWCGLEYFRSELYYLRFAWLSPGYAFGEMPTVAPLKHLGTYGVGFVLMSIACLAAWFWPRNKVGAASILVLGVIGFRLWGFGSLASPGPASAQVHIAGIQLEFPPQKQVLTRLTKLVKDHPEAELIILSEYTFTEAIPETVLDWCREHRKYLIAGGHDPAPRGGFYNTAFVISPEGEIVFRQVKSVPIQFFKDGEPAPRQELWESPWGKLGICICYDLSYTRVTDNLIRQGAQALIVPTMDVADWGRRQHYLHARVAPVRAAEYGVPIFRLASSGISQAVNANGFTEASAPCPGDGAVLSATLSLTGRGNLPVDRWLAPFSTGVTAFAGLWFLLCPVLKKQTMKGEVLENG